MTCTVYPLGLDRTFLLRAAAVAGSICVTRKLIIAL